MSTEEIVIQSQPTAQPETAIVPATPSALSTVNPSSLVSSLEGFEDAAITPANMVVVQKTTRDPDATPGMFKDMITGQQFKTIQIVPLKIQVNPGPRVLFEEGSPFGADPICRSNDGIKPATNSQCPQSEFCKTCKHASWDNWKGGKGKPPACKENAKILFVERESFLPYIMTAKGKSVSQVKGFLGAIMRHAATALAKGQRLGIFDFTAEMYLDNVVDSRGAYYVVKFRAPGGNAGLVGRVRTVGEFGPIYHELVRQRDVLAKAQDVEDVVPPASERATGTVPANQFVEAEVVDDTIPF